MTPCVLDASVICRWWLEDVDTDTTDAARVFLKALGNGDLEVHVPDLAYIEVTNAFWKASRFTGWPQVAVEEAVEHLTSLPIQAHSTKDLAASAARLAGRLGVSAYDGSYLALGVQLGIPIYTADEKLVSRAGDEVAELQSIRRR